MPSLKEILKDRKKQMDNMLDTDKEAMRPVRKSESGRYKGMTMEHMGAAGIDEDGESLKKKK